MNNSVMKALGHKFQFKLYNAGSSDLTVALLAGPFFCLGASTSYSSPNYTTTVHQHDTTNIKLNYSDVDAIADDGTPYTNLTCTALNSAFKVRDFREFVRQNPQTLRELHIAADNVEVYNEQITVSQWTPLTKAADQFLILSEFFRPDQYQTGKIIIPNIDLVLSDQTVMIMNIPDGRTVTFTFLF